MSQAACCSPSDPTRADLASTAISDVEPTTSSTDGMALVPEGEFMMGNERDYGYPEDGESPARLVRMSSFWIDATAVSNDDFSMFVAATGYVTESERFAWSFVFGGLLPDDFPPTRAVAAAPWWRQVEGADWRHPEGPQSQIENRGNHPVVHVSWNDAAAYARWASKDLPTEAEWEYAARGGLTGVRFPWGDGITPGGQHRMNVWQGVFPSENTVEDGYLGSAPVDAFTANGYGLYNMTGNVWEWCADWFHPIVFHEPGAMDPTGPTHGERRVMRGGSYLCHESYCYRYRVDSRSSNTPDSGSGNQGFRCVIRPNGVEKLAG